MSSTTDLLPFFLIGQLLPQQVHSMAQCSLNIIDSASSIQIDAAMKYNETAINKLLIKLLTINFINNNQNKIIHEMSDNFNQIETPSNNRRNFGHPGHPGHPGPSTPYTSYFNDNDNTSNHRRFSSHRNIIQTHKLSL